MVSAIPEQRKVVISERARKQLVVRIVQLIFLLFALLALGCGSVQEHRARQMKRDFAPLPEEKKVKILDGRIEHGFTTTMVYIALGTPKDIEKLETEVEQWTYVGWLEADGRFLTTSEMIFRSASTMQQLVVRFREGTVIDFESAPLGE